MTDEEFAKANKEYEEFKNDFKAFLEKWNCQYVDHDQYNGMDDYCGHEVYLTINGVRLMRDTLEELIKMFIEPDPTY